LKDWNIIWDYDGTILPFMPYDSEQFLLDYLVKSSLPGVSLFKKIISRGTIFADRRELLGHSFKKYYNWILKDLDASVLENVNRSIADLIPDSHIETFAYFHDKGMTMSIISCGTADLCIPPLRHKNAAGFFSKIISNLFTYEKNRISGMDFHVLKGEDKVKHAIELGYDPQKTIAVGDGYTDIPLLDWCSFPVLLDTEGRKQKKLSGKKYNFISAIPELRKLINKLEMLK
jgi:phosphoserine phosphatase